MGRDFSQHVKSFQESIHELDDQIDLFFELYQDDIVTDQVWENENLVNHSFFCFILENKSLVFWNSDILPMQDSSKVFSSQETRLVELSNGYYYIKSKAIKNKVVYAGKKIMSSYFYENDNLTTTLTKEFELPQEVIIDFKEGYGIENQSGETLFYIAPKNIGNISLFVELIIFLSFAIGLITFLLATSLWVKKLNLHPILRFLIYPAFTSLVWFLSLELEVFSFFQDFDLFAPDLFAASTFFSDLGTTIIELIFLGMIGYWLILYLGELMNKFKSNPKGSKPLVLVLFLLVFPFAYFINWFAESLVINSSISFELDNLFALSIFSYIGLFIMAILFLFYILIVKKVTALLVLTFAINSVAVLCFLFGIAYFFIDLFYGGNPLISAIWPLLINSLTLYYIYNRSINKTTWSLLVILIFSVYTTLNFYEFSVINEQQKRKFFADQIISDRDVTLELEFNDLVESIRKNTTFQNSISEEDGMSQAVIIDTLQDCCFSPFWDKYDIQLYLFDETGKDLLDYVENQSLSVNELNEIIKNHGETSEIREDLFYITDYFNRLSYLGRINLSLPTANRIIYFAFRSKKIPEEIGIPRLLLNRSSLILEDLKDYSIARYNDHQLLMEFGEFNFPTTKSAFDYAKLNDTQFSRIEGHSVYVRKGENDQLLLIAKPLKTFFEQLTGFSYIFIFYCLVLVLIFLLDGQFQFIDYVQLNLATKIQIVLIGLIILSFVLFGFVTGSYVRKQYGYLSNDNLKEKLESVHLELNQKLGDKNQLDPNLIGTYMEYILKKFSTVFATDINLYSNTGSLLASSQPSLYSRGISSTQINPNAFIKLIHHNKGDFIHKEKIGNLDYLSAYKPFLNDNNQQLGLINIKHFSKQRQYENQITGFLVAIINIAVLLLILTVIVALIVSKWITTPLRLIQQSFKSVDLGKQNKPIEYKRNDEIGALVKDYNNKVAELELKAMQLARNERETAWREMAKQVAHEIKNPLTPMKLRLQHFQRAFDPNDENAQKKISQITSSLVEQIDGLTKIANEFSNFAKMPKANEQALDLIPLLQNAVNLFGDENSTISFAPQLKNAIVWADKDLVIRVINNILKNAFQAIPESTEPKIIIDIKEDRKRYLLSFSDNGKGISKEDEHKIFVPNFTTKTTGAGLGLAMVKQIVQNHNGEIWFESELNKGTTFYILLEKYESKS
jgi:signal transduction histidine kinase